MPLQPCLTDTLLTAYTKSRLQSEPPDTFINLHKSLALLVLPPTETEILLNCQKKYANFPDAVHAVVQSGDLGALLYSFAVADIVAKDVVELIEKSAVTLITAAVTMDRFEKL